MKTDQVKKGGGGRNRRQSFFAGTPRGSRKEKGKGAPRGGRGTVFLFGGGSGKKKGVQRKEKGSGAPILPSAPLGFWKKKKKEGMSGGGGEIQ